ARLLDGHDLDPPVTLGGGGQQLAGGVCRAVVHQDELQRSGVVDGRETGEGRRQATLLVVGGDDYADAGKRVLRLAPVAGASAAGGGWGLYRRASSGPRPLGAEHAGDDPGLRGDQGRRQGDED